MKSLNLTQVIKNFVGETFKNEGKDFTLKEALLQLINHAHMMGLSKVEEATAYAAGMLIGGDKGTLSQDQYDVLKKLADNGKASVQQQEVPIYPNLAILQQVREMVNAAETVKEEKKG